MIIIQKTYPFASQYAKGIYGIQITGEMISLHIFRHGM